MKRYIFRAAKTLIGCIIVFGVVLAAGSPASADPAGPTDYSSEVTTIEPPVSGVEFGVVGGDAFVYVKTEPGVVVEVLGYRAEPYLRIEADGTVNRNELSPTRWLSEERYGNETPPQADHEAPPQWVKIANNGEHFWHDHRAHWMNPSRPPGAEAGDLILEAVIPVVVDGVGADVEVRSFLLASPTAPWPAALAGALLGLLVMVLALRQGASATAVALAVWSVLAAVVGVWGYYSVPAATGPSIMLWAPAVVAGIAAGIAVWFKQSRPRDQTLTLVFIIAVASVELLWWSWGRRYGITSAYIPTNAPYWAERSVTAGAGAAAVVALVGGMVWLRPGPLPSRTR